MPTKFRKIPTLSNFFVATPTYVNGDLNGFCEEYDAEHRLTFEGNYRNGIRCGFIKTYDEFGGSVVGTVDDTGALTGDDCIAYVYPDGVTALVGTFSDGEMVSARPVHLRHPVKDCLPDHDAIGESPCITVGYDESTSKVISTSPLVPDSYEQERVYVAPSLIPGAGEGLFASLCLSCLHMYIYKQTYTTPTPQGSTKYTVHHNIHVHLPAISFTQSGM